MLTMCMVTSLGSAVAVVVDDRSWCLSTVEAVSAVSVLHRLAVA